MEAINSNAKQPTIWKRFTSKEQEFWIQTVEDYHAEVIVNAMIDLFFVDEPIAIYSKYCESPNFKTEIKSTYEEIVPEGISIVCLTNKNGSVQVAGFLCLVTSGWLKNCKHQSFVQQLVNIGLKSRKKYVEMDVQNYLAERGLLVFPEWRGFGIGKELLLCWPMVCKSLGLKLGYGSFTSRFSQAAAESAGLVEVNSIPYTDLRVHYPHFAPEGVEEHTKSMKLFFAVV